MFVVPLVLDVSILPQSATDSAKEYPSKWKTWVKEWAGKNLGLWSLDRERDVESTLISHDEFAPNRDTDMWGGHRTRSVEKLVEYICISLARKEVEERRGKKSNDHVRQRYIAQ